MFILGVVLTPDPLFSEISTHIYVIGFCNRLLAYKVIGYRFCLHFKHNLYRNFLVSYHKVVLKTISIKLDVSIEYPSITENLSEFLGDNCTLSQCYFLPTDNQISCAISYFVNTKTIYTNNKHLKFLNMWNHFSPSPCG